jgi:hypothetical protein
MHPPSVSANIKAMKIRPALSIGINIPMRRRLRSMPMFGIMNDRITYQSCRLGESLQALRIYARAIWKG